MHSTRAQGQQETLAKSMHRIYGISCSDFVLSRIPSAFSSGCSFSGFLYPWSSNQKNGKFSIGILAVLCHAVTVLCAQAIAVKMETHPMPVFFCPVLAPIQNLPVFFFHSPESLSFLFFNFPQSF